MRVPPQKGWLPLADTSATCQGYSCCSVSTPPTILLLPAWPQLQLPGAAVVEAAVLPVGAAVLPVVVVVSGEAVVVLKPPASTSR